MRSLAAALLVLLAGCESPVPQSNETGVNGSAASEAPIVQPGSVEPGRVEAVPAPFHGVYDRSLEACSTPSEYRLTISAGHLRFHESIGVVRSVAVEGPDTIRVSADFQGEGESWTADQQLRLSGAGSNLTVTSNGTNTDRVRCASNPEAAATPRWQSAASGEGVSLFFAQPGGEHLLTLFCPADSSDLIVNVSAFSPIGSEERMSFGSGGTVVALVADPSGDSGRGGVTGRGPLPADLRAILGSGEGISVSYGSQTSGPHAVPPPDFVRAFFDGCRN